MAVPTLRIAQPTGDAALQEGRHIHNTIVPARPLSPDDVRERSTRNLPHVGYAGEEAVGCTTVRPPADGSSTAVVIARVLAPHRGQGLGEQLYAFALERAREPGAQTLETVVLATNEDGLRCAQRHGFAEFDRYVLPGDTVAFVALRRGSEEVRAGYRAAWGASPARPHVRDSMDGLGVARAMGRLDVVTAALGTGSA